MTDRVPVKGNSVDRGPQLSGRNSIVIRLKKSKRQVTIRKKTNGNLNKPKLHDIVRLWALSNVLCELK